MPVYHHFNEAKKANSLPMADSVGACLTCNWWAVEAPRTEEEIQEVGLCVQPSLKDFALIVSGSSACNKWKDKVDAGESAHQYAKQGEAQA